MTQHPEASPQESIWDEILVNTSTVALVNNFKRATHLSTVVINNIIIIALQYSWYNQPSPNIVMPCRQIQDLSPLPGLSSDEETYASVTHHAPNLNTSATSAQMQGGKSTPLPPT